MVENNFLAVKVLTENLLKDTYRKNSNTCQASFKCPYPISASGKLQKLNKDPVVLNSPCKEDAYF